MWQVCPMCKGSGQALTIVDMVANSICPVCNGKRIINEMTGLPPTGHVKVDVDEYGIPKLIP